MLASHPIRKFAGLCSSANPINGDVPEGAMAVADNVVIRSPNVLEPRRGYSASLAGHVVNALTYWNGSGIALTYNNPGSGVPGALTSFLAPSGNATSLTMNPGAFPFDAPGSSSTADTRFVSANKALYFQSQYGLTKIESLTGATCRCALQPKPFWSTSGRNFASSVTSASGSWLANGNQVAYRFTIARFGANGELIESEPSERYIFSNTSGSACGTTIQVLDSWMVAPDAFVRIWRSKQVANGTDPADELFLVAEAPYAGLPTDAYGYVQHFGSIGYTDVTPDGSLYVPLYTNPLSGDGIAFANTPAPLSADMAWFKNRMYFLNTSDVQRLTIKVIGTGSGGIQVGDWITVNGVKFVFSSSGYQVQQPVLSTGGTVAQNIDASARELAAAINQYFSITFPVAASAPQYAIQAVYISGSSTDAGQILLQTLVPNAVPITIQTSTRSGWDRDYTAGYSSNSNPQIAGLSWSNVDQPEGVPLANSAIVGDASLTALRCIPVKDSLFIFKDGDGLWKVTDDGSTIGPQITQFDPTVRLLAPETAVAIDNSLIALCEDGVVLVSETGKVNLSAGKIDKQLLKLVATVGRATFAKYAHAVASQSEHTYILSVPESPAATACTRQFVFNIETETWTSWTLPGTFCGTMNPDTTQLAWGVGTNWIGGYASVWTERKSFTSLDYQDPTGIGAIVNNMFSMSADMLTFTVESASLAIAPGDLIQQWSAGSYAYTARVTSVTTLRSSGITVFTVDSAPKPTQGQGWDPGNDIDVIKSVGDNVQFLPIVAGSALALTAKNWGDTFATFRYLDAYFIFVSFANELYPIPDVAKEQVSGLTTDSPPPPISLVPWAPDATGFGKNAWGRQTKDITLKWTRPINLNRSAQLTLGFSAANACTRYELNGLDFKMINESDRTVR